MKVDVVLDKLRRALRAGETGSGTPEEYAAAEVAVVLTRGELGVLMAEVSVLRAQHDADVRERDFAWAETRSARRAVEEVRAYLDGRAPAEEAP